MMRYVRQGMIQEKGRERERESLIVRPPGRVVKDGAQVGAGRGGPIAIKRRRDGSGNRQRQNPPVGRVFPPKPRTSPQEAVTSLTPGRTMSKSQIRPSFIIFCPSPPPCRPASISNIKNLFFFSFLLLPSALRLPDPLPLLIRFSGDILHTHPLLLPFHSLPIVWWHKCFFFI